MFTHLKSGLHFNNVNQEEPPSYCVADVFVSK